MRKHESETEPGSAVAEAAGSGSHGPKTTAEATEDTPLLMGDPTENMRRRYRQNTIALIMLLLFFVELGQGLMGPPSTAILEDVVCRRYHPTITRGFWNGLLDNAPVCKHADVQGYMAVLSGWRSTLDTIPGILVSVPFGLLSDTWGRRPVLALSMFGILLSLFWIYFVYSMAPVIPVWAALFSSSFMFIGGGAPVLTSMLWTMAADVVPAAERATVFFQVMSVYLVSELLSGPLASFLMLHNPAWTTIVVGLFLMTTGFLIIFLFPETLEIRKLHDRLVHAVDSDEDDSDSDADADEPKEPRLKRLLREARKSLDEIRIFVLGNKRVSFLLLSLVFVFLGRFVQEMLLQYVTKRYGWSWSKASLLLSIKSATHLVMLLLVLPGISWVFVHRLGMSPLVKDLILTRFSTLALVLGALVIALAANGTLLVIGLVVLALGGGQSALIRSLANALVEEHHVGILNTLIGFLEQVGLMVAGPVLSQSLRIGFDLGGAWVGLPFACAALLFSVAFGIVCTFRIPKRRLSFEFS